MTSLTIATATPVLTNLPKIPNFDLEPRLKYGKLASEFSSFSELFQAAVADQIAAISEAFHSVSSNHEVHSANLVVCENSKMQLDAFYRTLEKIDNFFQNSLKLWSDILENPACEIKDISKQCVADRLLKIDIIKQITSNFAPLRDSFEKASQNYLEMNISYQLSTASGSPARSPELTTSNSTHEVVAAPEETTTTPSSTWRIFNLFRAA